MNVIPDKTDCKVLKFHPKSNVYQTVVWVGVVLHIEFFNGGNIVLVFSPVRAVCQILCKVAEPSRQRARLTF